MPSSAVLSGISAQGSAQAYHQLQSQHASRAAYPQSNDPLLGHKIHSQYPNYGSGGGGVQTLVRGQYPTDQRYVQHGISDYNSAMTQSHLSLQSGAQSQPSMPASAYGQQNMIGQYAGQRMHSPGVTPSRQPSGPMHGMPSHYSSSYPSNPTQGGYHSHANPNSDLWSSQGVPHMQQSSSYAGYPGSGPSGPSSLSSVSHPPGMHGPRAGQSQYVSHSEYSASAMHQQQEQQRQYYSSSGGPTGTASMTGHIPTDGPALPYPTPPQGPYSGSSASQQASTRGPHSVPRQQYMSYSTGTSLQPQPPSQQVSQAQQQNSGSSISRYPPHQYPGYPQPTSYGDTSAQSRLSPYPLPQQPTGPNSPQYRPGYPSSAASQMSAVSPRRPTTTPPAGSPMPPSSHTPDRSATTTTSSQASTHSFPISPGANHLSSPVQGMSPGSSVPTTPSSLQQLEQMVMPHLAGVQNSSKASIPVSTNSSSSSSTSSYYGSVGPTTPSAGAAPPSPQPPPNSGQRQSQSLYSHYPTTGNMPSNQSQQYQYHQYQQQNSSHWSGPPPNQLPSAAVSSNSATSLTNTHSIGGVSGIPLQPQSTLPSIGQSQAQSNTNLQQHQNSPSVASNSSSPNVSKNDVSIPATNSISGQYNSYSSEINNTVSASDSNYSQTFVSRSTTSSTNSTPSSSSSSSQPLQSGYNVTQSTNSNSASFDSPVIKAQHKQQAAQNDTQSQQQQSQSQAAVAQMASPTNIFDSIKSPNAGTPRPLAEQLANDLQHQQQQQSNQQQSERIPTSQTVPGPQPPHIGGVPHQQSHHPYHHQMMHQQLHQPYPTQQMPNYSNSYDPGLNYELNAVTSDLSQSSAPYGEHDSSMMYDSYGMDNMVPPQMADYHRDSADFMDPYSAANFDDSYGEPPTKRKGKGRPKKDPNEPKKERKPRQPRAPRGSGRGRGRGNKNNMSDRLPPMPPMIPPEYDGSYGMPSENMDIYSQSDIYGQQMPPSTQSPISQSHQQSIPTMPLTPQAPPQQQQQQPPPQPPPPPPPQSPPPQQQSQTNHSQQQLQTQQQSQNETPITSPEPIVQSQNYTSPIAEQPIPQIIEKPMENEQTLYEDNFLDQSSANETNNNMNETLISMPTDEEPSLSVAVPSEADLYTPPRQISPCPPPVTDEVIPEPKIDSYEFADEQFASTPVKGQKKKKAKKRKPKKEVETEEPESEALPPKAKKPKKKKKKQNQNLIVEELEPKEPNEPQIEDTESSLKASQTTDFDDATQESSQCESSAIESSTGKSSNKKEKGSKKDSKPKKPKIKNKSPKKKLPKLALKFSKNKKRRRFGSPVHSDLERTPPPSPDEADSGIQKRRSARNTKRQKYTDDIELELSEDDDKKVDSNGLLGPVFNSDGKIVGEGPVVSVMANINEDTMVVEKILTSRMGQRELEVENPETTESDPNFKAPTIEVEEFFVKYKNLSYFHCEWKTEEELEKGDRRISQKIKRFRQKKDVMNMFDFLDEEPYNPDYVEVDRILDVNEIEEIIEPYPTNSGTENEDKIEAKETKDDDSQNQITKTDTNEVKDSEEFTSVPKESEKIDSESNVEKIKEELETNEEKLDNDSDDKTQDNSETDLDKKETETKEEVEANEEKDKELNDIEKREENSDKETKEVVEAPVQTRKVKHYLVKWRALAYEDSTWELEDDLDPLKVEQFWKFRKPPPKSEWKPKRRPKPADWKKIEESPVYKGDNTLREYQLEGLNWLSFCWYNRSVDD